MSRKRKNTMTFWSIRTSDRTRLICFWAIVSLLGPLVTESGAQGQYSLKFTIPAPPASVRFPGAIALMPDGLSTHENVPGSARQE